jgi:hypothetical protein
LWGSGIYRSIQFSAFEATYNYYDSFLEFSWPLANFLKESFKYNYFSYTLFDNKFGKAHINSTHGLELRVILAGIMAGTVRSLIETPLEYVKVILFFL